MIETDRDGFAYRMRMLCGAFNVPATPDRLDAYWSGLTHMTFAQFERVVEYAMGERGPERMPTAHVCWELSRMLAPIRAQGALPTVRAANEAAEYLDLEANKLLLLYVQGNVAMRPGRYGSCAVSRGGLSIGEDMQARVALLVQAKNLWAMTMRECPDDRTPEMRKRWWDELFEAAEQGIDRLIAQAS